VDVRESAQSQVSNAVTREWDVDCDWLGQLPPPTKSELRLLEAVGPAISKEQMLTVRGKTRAAIYQIGANIKPGMIEGGCRRDGERFSRRQ